MDEMDETAETARSSVTGRREGTQGATRGRREEVIPGIGAKEGRVPEEIAGTQGATRGRETTATGEKWISANSETATEIKATEAMTAAEMDTLVVVMLIQL